MRNTRRVMIAALAAATLAGCGSELRRNLHDVIDQREAGAHAQIDAYKAFETQTLDELDATWGATADTGCPAREPLPELPNHGRFSFDRDEMKRREAIDDEVWETRKAAWVANVVPARQCDCLQETLRSVNRAINAIDADNVFDAEREMLDALTDEELASRGPIPRSIADAYSAEKAQEYIDQWTERRVQGGFRRLHGNQPGWNDAALHADAVFEEARRSRTPEDLIGQRLFQDCFVF